MYVSGGGLPNMSQALGSMPSTEKQKRKLRRGVRQGAQEVLSKVSECLLKQKEDGRRKIPNTVYQIFLQFSTYSAKKNPRQPFV